MKVKVQIILLPNFQGKNDRQRETVKYVEVDEFYDDTEIPMNQIL